MTGQAPENSGPPWGLCATVKAPVEQVQAFVAHHLSLGAARIWIYLDDPEDPAAAALTGIDRVTVTRCTAAHWGQAGGKRPEAQEQRQGRNMSRTYRTCGLPWLGHIDVDEFLLPSQPVSTLLATVPSDHVALRMRPWEALEGPDLPDDIFTANLFRKPVSYEENPFLNDDLFGDYGPLFAEGAFSHAIGKCFFRTGVPGLHPRLHNPFIDGKKVTGLPYCNDLPLLHFHAQDRAGWKAAAPGRAIHGAYRFNKPLAAFLQNASAAEVDALYTTTQSPAPETLARWERRGAILRADLGLRAKVVALFGEP